MTRREEFQSVLREVAFNHMVDEREILGRGRAREVCLARHSLYSRLHSEGRSYAEIGRLLNRDHTTIMYGVRQAREARA